MLVGVVLGELLALALAQVLGSMQSGIRSPAPIVYAAAGVVWMARAMAATFLPASRASRVNPLVPLRSE